jgi:WD40 repeat protein
MNERKIPISDILVQYISTFIALSALAVFPGCSATTEFGAVLGSVAYAPDGKLIAAGRSGMGTIFLYDGTTVQVTKTITTTERKFGSLKSRSVAFSADSRYLAAAGIDQSLDAWDLTTDQQVLHIPELKGASAIAFSPTANILGIAGPGSDVTLWTVPEGKLIATLRGNPTAQATALAVSPDGKRVATGGRDRTVRLWSLPDGKEIGILDSQDQWVHSLSFSADGRMLAVYAGGVRVWDVLEKGSLMQASPDADFVLAGFLGAGETLAGPLPTMFSPDGKFLALLRHSPFGLSGDYEVVILNWETKKRVSIQCQCFSFTFSPDGSKLVTVGHPGLIPTSAIRVWDPNTGERIQ